MNQVEFFLQQMKFHAQRSFEVLYLDNSMPMINCSRSGLTPLKFYWIIQTLGLKGLKKQAKNVLENALYLKNELDKICYPAWIKTFGRWLH